MFLRVGLYLQAECLTNSKCIVLPLMCYELNVLFLNKNFQKIRSFVCIIKHVQTSKRPRSFKNSSRILYKPEEISTKKQLYLNVHRHFHESKMCLSIVDDNVLLGAALFTTSISSPKCLKPQFRISTFGLILERTRARILFKNIKMRLKCMI